MERREWLPHSRPTYDTINHNATSVGFIPHQISDEPVKEGQKGVTYQVIELIELSGVTVPANKNALKKCFDLLNQYDDFEEMYEKGVPLNQYFKRAGLDIEHKVEIADIVRELRYRKVF